MGYLDGMLAREERIVLQARRHPLFMVLNAGPYLLGVAFMWAVALVSILVIPDVRDVNVGLILGLIFLIVSLVPLAVGVYRILHWLREQYVITNFRIIQVEGMMNRRTFDSALEKVNDVILSQSVFGRMFNYGSINIVTGSEAAINDIAGVSDPFEFKRSLMEAKMEFANRGFDDDGFPTRRQVAASTASESNTDRLPRFDSEQDQSRAVIALTELRNSGVISDAEFNEKLRRLTETN